MITLRPGNERGHADHGWLRSFHSFSFANYRDPRHMGFGPLRVINDDVIAPGKGFGMHPHQDMEIITVLVEGQLNHRDSMGHAEVLCAGEVQRMSAGTGIVHSEINEGPSPCRLLQIWIEPSSRGIPPSYEQKAMSLATGWTLLLDPDGVDGALAIHRPVRLWRAQAAAGASLPVAIKPGALGWMQMIEGSGRLMTDGTDSLMPLQRGDGLGFAASPSAGQPLAITAGSAGADLLLFEMM